MALKSGDLDANYPSIRLPLPRTQDLPPPPPPKPGEIPEAAKTVANSELVIHFDESSDDAKSELNPLITKTIRQQCELYYQCGQPLNQVANTKYVAFELLNGKNPKLLAAFSVQEGTEAQQHQSTK